MAKVVSENTRLVWATGHPWPPTEGPACKQSGGSCTLKGTVIKHNSITVRREDKLQGHLKNDTSSDVMAEFWAIHINVESVSSSDGSVTSVSGWTQMLADGPESFTQSLKDWQDSSSPSRVYTLPTDKPDVAVVWAPTTLSGSLRSQGDRDTALLEGDEVEVTTLGKSLLIGTNLKITKAVAATYNSAKYDKGPINVDGFGDKIMSQKQATSENDIQAKQAAMTADNGDCAGDDEWD
eukprot:GFYU01004286.1.p1 GENE.GFYU01004286.1~~GFYU01004286.1.p1  ORF type:complete len:237 (-),score=55.23 GFYU01004286.1:342-1052(-)